MAKNYKKKNQQTALEIIFIGIFKALWWLITLPFKRKKKSGIDLDTQKYITTKRLEIERLSISENEIELRHAMMEADKLVDYIFQKKGFLGETFADRLRSAEDKIDTEIYQLIWQGHKIRNQIAHDDNKISTSELKKAIFNLLYYTKRS